MRCTARPLACLPQLNLIPLLPSRCPQQAVITLTEPTFPEAGTAAVDLEELRFLTTDGSLLLEYGLSYALDSHRRTTRMLRLGSGPGFGRLQGRPLDEAAAHFAALREAAKQQPLRTASGR